MASDESGNQALQHPEPHHKRELLERAKETNAAVTDVEVKERGDGDTVRAYAIIEADGTAYKVTIIHHAWAEDGPSVKFARSHWDADVAVLRSWSSEVTTPSTSPQALSEWRLYFTTFNAALHAYRDEVGR